MSGGYPQHHVPLLDSVVGGGMVDEILSHNMTKNNQKSASDGTLKRVRTEVSDSSSSEEESMTNLNILKKSKVISGDTWPRFLVISSSDEGALKTLSPFAIQKALVGLAGEPKSVKKIRNGSLLVECSTERHSQCLLKSKIFCNIKIHVTPHLSLNTSKGVIRCRDLEGMSDDEICKELSSQDVAVVKRIRIRRNDEFIPTNTFILTFSKPTLPQSVKAGYLNIPVEPFVPNPLRCFTCQKYGHGQNTCRNKMTCARCGQFDHESKSCTNDIMCVNCKGKHFAYSRECAKWKLEKKVQQVKVEKRISFPDARKLVELSTPVVAEKSYAAAVKITTKSVATNTDLTWPYNEPKFKKLSDIERSQRQVAKAAHKQKEADQKLEKAAAAIAIQTSQASLDSSNQSSSSRPGVPGSSSSQKNKNKKSSSRDRSDRLKKIEMKSIPISNNYTPLDLDVDDMDVSSISQPQRPPPKPKVQIVPVLPPDDK